MAACLLWQFTVAHFRRDENGSLVLQRLIPQAEDGRLFELNGTRHVYFLRGLGVSPRTVNTVATLEPEYVERPLQYHGL